MLQDNTRKDKSLLVLLCNSDLDREMAETQHNLDKNYVQLIAVVLPHHIIELKKNGITKPSNC